jgi:hypothetical protein
MPTAAGFVQYELHRCDGAIRRTASVSNRRSPQVDRPSPTSRWCNDPPRVNAIRQRFLRLHVTLALRRCRGPLSTASPGFCSVWETMRATLPPTSHGERTISHIIWQTFSHELRKSCTDSQVRSAVEGTGVEHRCPCGGRAALVFIGPGDKDPITVCAGRRRSANSSTADSAPKRARLRPCVFVRSRRGQPPSPEPYR